MSFFQVNVGFHIASIDHFRRKKDGKTKRDFTGLTIYIVGGCTGKLGYPARRVDTARLYMQLT